MISDVLAEAVDEIDHYLADPHIGPQYDAAAIHAEILAVRAAMDALRVRLDEIEAPAAPPAS